MSSAAVAFPSEQVVWRPKVNPWLIGATVSIAAFVEVLDTSVANVALPYIAGAWEPVTTTAHGYSPPTSQQTPSSCP
jgi:hypothetical protein